MWLLLTYALCHAQPAQGNLRRIVFTATADSVQLDTYRIAYNSVVVYSGGTRLNAGFIVDHNKAMLMLDSSLLGKELEIWYRVLIFSPVSSFTRKSRDLIEPTFTTEPRAFYNYRQERSASEAIFGDGLNVVGNIARGIGFGNNQDVVLNSNLNLQMNGRLGKGITIQAAISDENNPIQPQGNTQQIQDFDKVYISVFKDSNALTVGDFLMQTDQDQYFMKFYKKSRGLKLDYQDGSKVKQHLQVNGAVSRGKFVRNEIQGQEGIQGPYRLSGANGELNIIIISGTEVIYLDGQKLERGQQNDYIIDYNTGELTFMPGRLINRYNRIIAEFQYSDRNYARSVFTVSDGLRFGKWRASVNYFSEQDNKLQPTDTSNGSEVQSVLENAGDAPAIFRYERQFRNLQADRVNYRKTDSLGFEIYIFTNDPLSDTVFYTTTFSLLGKGKGNYIQVASSANGRVFAWVQPVNNQPAGEYEPYVELVAPKRQQMLTANAAYSDGRHFDLRVEAAYSNNNQNAYSTLDKRNDDGLGFFISLKQKDMRYKGLKLGTSFKMEFVNRNFAYIERYRSVEFSRIWNRQLNNTVQSTGANELISTFAAVISKQEKHKLTVEASNYNKTGLFEGYRGMADYGYTGARLSLRLAQEQISTRGKNGSIGFRNKAAVSRFESVYAISKMRFGASAVIEESVFNTDTAQGPEISSFRYEMVSGFLESQALERWAYKIDGNYRADYQPQAGVLTYLSAGTNVNAMLEHAGKKMNRLKFVGSYRKLNETGVANDDEVILSRIEYNGSFFKKIISSSTYYQVGTGREQKRQFSYALVQSGNGTHTWVDYNGNGIEEVNEFELAVFKDQARYVKVYLPTNEFLKSNTNEFNQTIRIQAPQNWQSGTPAKRFISRFNTITSYRADRRITDNRLQTILNPFKLDVNDSALIAVSSLIKQTTFFNRSNAVFGLEHNIQTNKSKQFLNSGFEWRQSDRQQLVGRLAFSRSVNLVLDAVAAIKQNRNDFFENRNYNYRLRSLQPELFYQTLKGVRIGTYFKYTEAFNAPEFGDDQAFISETGLEFRYFIINKGNFDAKVASHSINFKGNANSPLAFDVLNGLSNGQNLTWTLGFGGKTKGNIQISVGYEGRRTQINKTVHIGRAEARYIF